MTAPIWPTMPVSWVMIGACRTRNHRATSRSTEVKTMASPAPTRAREASPVAKLSACENHTCPAVMQASPARMSALDP